MMFGKDYCETLLVRTYVTLRDVSLIHLPLRKEFYNR
jgi:hypothetical protein